MAWIFFGSIEKDYPYWRLPMPDGTTIPRTCSAVLPPLQSSKTGPQSPEHVLQSCSLFREATTQQWPLGATLKEQLWGNMEGLLKTPTFIQTTFWNRTMLERSRREEERKKERKRPVFGIFNLRAGADAVDCARGLRTPWESLYWKLTLGEKSLESNPREYRAWLFSRTLYQLSYPRSCRSFL